MVIWVKGALQLGDECQPSRPRDSKYTKIRTWPMGVFLVVNLVTGGSDVVPRRCERFFKIFSLFQVSLGFRSSGETFGTSLGGDDHQGQLQSAMVIHSLELKSIIVF